FLAPHGARDLLRLLHLTLADLDLSVDHRLLLKLDPRLPDRDLDRGLLADRPIGWSRLDRVALDEHLLAGHRDVDALLLGDHLLAEPDLAGLLRLRMGYQPLLAQLDPGLGIGAGRPAGHRSGRLRHRSPGGPCGGQAGPGASGLEV